MKVSKGVLSAVAAYALWGFFPIYFKALQAVPAFQITAHRVVWSFLFVMVVVAARGEFPTLKSTLTLRTVLVYLAAGVLLTVNWLTYVWSITAGFIVEASLGYFINPLVSVLLGVIFLRERLRPAQWVPVGLAAIGVVYLTFTHGSFPWIALVLAVTFGLYGLMKKIAPLGSLHGLTLETGTVFLFAMGYLIFAEASGAGAFGHIGWLNSILLALTGVVTAIPLLLFATGARSVPLSTVGLLQFVSPTLQFLIGVFLFNEPFTHTRVIGFVIIWLALLVFSAESYIHYRRLTAPAAAL